MATGATSRSIPSLDGLRAFSVALVILAHSLAYLPLRGGQYPLLQVAWLGQSGVDIFFVISGFLITYLLLKEHDASGTIRLKNFYFRRFFRIFPPFYAFLAVVGLLWVFHAVPLDLRSFVNAATYTSNYRGVFGWVLAHTWSLSLEEQFYLLWPPCLVLFGRRNSTFLAVGVILVSPAVRVLQHW